MHYFGEIISLLVAFFWTITALCFEYASKKSGALPLNIIRLGMAFVMLGITLWIATGSPLPLSASRETWTWLAISGLIGFVFGDYCLFHAYVQIGSRFTQLMMTLAPPAAAIGGALILGEELHSNAVMGMIVTLTGIILSIVGRGEGESSGRLRLKIPFKGLLLAIGAGIGQGIGLVFSKLGMDYFTLDLNQPDAAHIANWMVPFAASQIRIITGIVGFFLILLFTKQLHLLKPALKQGKAMGMASIGTLFGPFLGVSFSLMAVQYTQTGIASTLMALTPIIIIWPSYLLFKQKISATEIIGSAISILGVSLFFLS